MAAIDGVTKKIEPGDPVNRSIYKMSRQEVKELGIKELPKNLEDALSALGSDNDFLRPVFAKTLIDTYIDISLSEARDLNRYPSPVEVERLLSKGI
jgi:glutamine synthetase